jgi:hypothetical protein
MAHKLPVVLARLAARLPMAFDLNDAPTVQRLKDCSSDPSKDFFVANDAAALQSAFESIKAAVASEIYLSN